MGGKRNSSLRLLTATERKRPLVYPVILLTHTLQKASYLYRKEGLAYSSTQVKRLTAYNKTEVAYRVNQRNFGPNIKPQRR